ncbi:MAG: hypothetical protein U1E87_09100 [Alphaproteobacteria bacterium]
MKREARRGIGREDLHDAADRVRAIEKALRSAHDLDPADIGRGECGEVGCDLRRGGVRYANAVIEDERAVGLLAANSHGRDAARPAVLRDIDAGNGAQCIGRESRAAAFDIVGRQQADGRADLAQWRFGSRRRDDNRLGRFCARRWKWACAKHACGGQTKQSGLG